MEQLRLDLTPANPFSLEYFVEHSGVAESLRILRQTIEKVASLPGTFAIAVITGPTGSGKTHLAQGICDAAQNIGIPEDQLCVVELDDSSFASSTDNDSIAAFIARYEALQSAGGLMLVATCEPPNRPEINPHVRSRLLAGNLLELKFPEEEELARIVEVLFEKRNIRISEQSVRFLVSRLPAVPLSFASISGKIDRVSSLLGKPARFGLIREIAIAEGAVAK